MPRQFSLTHHAPGWLPGAQALLAPQRKIKPRSAYSKARARTRVLAFRCPKNCDLIHILGRRCAAEM